MLSSIALHTVLVRVGLVRGVTQVTTLSSWWELMSAHLNQQNNIAESELTARIESIFQDSNTNSDAAGLVAARHDSWGQGAHTVVSAIRVADGNVGLTDYQKGLSLIVGSKAEEIARLLKQGALHVCRTSVLSHHGMWVASNGCELSIGFPGQAPASPGPDVFALELVQLWYSKDGSSRRSVSCRFLRDTLSSVESIVK